VRTIPSGDLEQDRTVSDLDPATHAILHALAEGLSQREIARALSYSERTIQRRTTNLCLALGALTPAQAVHFAHRRGMLR
jgi:DNA-binding NarL/FixJ family response regulator